MIVPRQLAQWHEDHVNTAGLLDLLQTQVELFHKGERPSYPLMADIVAYLRAYSDCVHHPREDVAFTLLVARDAGVSRVVSRLMQEHRVLAWTGEELRRRIEEADLDTVSPRSALEAAAATYLVFYRNHLNREEREILPLARELLTEEDWAAVDAAGPLVEDPLFGAQVTERFRQLRRAIDLQEPRRQRAAPAAS